MRYEIKTRSITEILDGAFQLYRNHWMVFVQIAAAAYLPALILQELVTWSLTGGTVVMPTGKGAQVPGGWLSVLINVQIMTLSYSAVQAMVSSTVGMAFIGQKLSVPRAFRRLLPALLSLLGAAALNTIGIALGFVLFVVPGILLMLSWLFYSQVIIFEHLKASASLRRSRQLAYGHRGSLFVLIWVLGLIQLAITVGAAFLLPKSITGVPFIGGLLGALPSLILSPLTPCAMTLAYFDARARREAFDLSAFAASMGGSHAADVPAVVDPA